MWVDVHRFQSSGGRMFVVDVICRGLMKLMTSRLWRGVFTPAFWVCLSLRLPAKQVLPCLQQKQTLEPAAAKKRATHHPSALKYQNLALEQLETSKSRARAHSYTASRPSAISQSEGPPLKAKWWHMMTWVIIPSLLLSLCAAAGPKLLQGVWWHGVKPLLQLAWPRHCAANDYVFWFNSWSRKRLKNSQDTKVLVALLWKSETTTDLRLPRALLPTGISYTGARPLLLQPWQCKVTLWKKNLNTLPPPVPATDSTVSFISCPVTTPHPQVFQCWDQSFAKRL